MKHSTLSFDVLRTARAAVLSVSLACSSGVARAQSNGPVLLRDPTVSHTQIAFTYAASIWIADRDTLNLRRLTSGGHEEKPVFSPDGSQIAFAGEYDGTHAIFVVPAAGGEPRRLTYHPGDLTVTGWTPDGRRILFSSRRAAFARAVIQLFSVPLEGGFATQVPLARASEESISPDAERIAYVAGVPAQLAWKHYRGGQSRAIWIANLADSRIQATVPRNKSSDFNPMWVDDKTIYFLSDRNGSVTLFSYDLVSQQVKQVLENDGMDIKAAAATPEAIVYEQFGSLKLLDLQTRRVRALNIRPVVDLRDVRPHFQKIAKERLVSATMAPDGAGVAFGVRGEILTVPAERGDVRNLSRTVDVVERDPAWSPDGRFIAYFSDESGEYALHIREKSGSGEVRKIRLANPPSFYYSPTWSPDSKKIGYADARLNYWYVDLEAKTSVRIDNDLFIEPSPADSDNPAHGLRMAWSPDSRWIAYTKQLRSHWHAAFAYSIAHHSSAQLTDGTSDVYYLAFDKSGKYLYFTASTDVALSTSWIDMSGLQHPITRGVYALMLRKGLPSPFIPQDDGNMPAGTDNKAAENAPMKVEIDLDDIERRIVSLPIPAHNYYGLFAGKPGTIFIVEGPPVDPLVPYSVQYEPPGTKVHKFSLGNPEAELLLDDVTHFDLSFNGEKMLYVKHGNWFIASAEAPSRAGTRALQLKLDSMEIFVDPRAEWKHMYQQVWRDERDFFYDPHLHGLDLNAAEKQYEPYLENIASRKDLNYLFNEMLGNMVVSHLFAAGGDVPDSRSVKIGLLGADYSIEHGRYRVSKIYGGDTWDPGVRGPLTQPGVNVQAGDYLLALNGRDIRSSADFYSYFEETAGKEVELTVGPMPDGRGSRTVVVTPVEDEGALRNYAWVEDNRRTVDRLTGGRVAYIYVPDTNARGYMNFNRYYFSQVGKDAAIIDERYNGGGSIPDYIIDQLRRPLLSYVNVRDGRDITTPLEAIFGPKVLLINEMASSGGDALAWLFRAAGIGPLVGKSTWGGVVGWYRLPGDLLDGGLLTTPNAAFYKPNGAWDVENSGVPPDLDVEYDPQAVRSGHDPQLEAAVTLVLHLLEANPSPPAPRHAPFPNYHQSRP